MILVTSLVVGAFRRVGASVSVSSVAGSRHVRSVDTRTLVLHGTRTVLGVRDFAVSSAVAWNSLPAASESRHYNCGNIVRHLKAQGTCFRAWTGLMLLRTFFYFARYKKCARSSFPYYYS